MQKLLGTIISGSLAEGLIMRAAPSIALADLKAGKFVSIKDGPLTYFCLITDIQLGMSQPDIALSPPMAHETLLSAIVRRKDTYTTISLRPMLTLDERFNKQPVKTVPAHFSPVFDACAHDVASVFGDEKAKDKAYFNIGCPLDMQTPICIDMDKFVERSNGIFGKTGTGKTFLTRLLLAGTIKHNKAVNLIFDMHNEYGIQARQEGSTQTFVKGLKTLFPHKIALCSLDPEATRRRGANPDIEFHLSYQAIHVEDIISLEHELNLHPTALEAAYLIASRYKDNWLEELLNTTKPIKDFAQETGAHPESVAALYRKLKRIEQLPFFKKTPDRTSSPDCVTQLLEYLKSGTSVIIEFGNFTSSFCYLLVANIITRRIHAAYVEQTECFLSSQKSEDRPLQLLITIEEAHKFLNTQAAAQTIFGTIAREMRKYYVSLLVVDQRPSGIDPEVLSQIGTKVIAQLSDERDIQAVLVGSYNSNQLRSVLASLDSKKQALLLGHALAMPVVVHTRSYDETFYKAMLGENNDHTFLEDPLAQMYPTN